MPRRRMIDPSLTDDLDIAQLSFTERWFLVGALRNADDEGRLQGHQGFIKSQIFPYDDDIDNKTAREIMESALKKMATWDPNNVWRLVGYKNETHEFLYFPNWLQFNKPSHGVASRLPPPPQSQSLQSPSRDSPEARQSASGGTPPQSRSGQSSLGKGSIGQESSGEALEDLTNISDKKDLTDLTNLTTTLEKFLPAEPLKAMAAIKNYWRLETGKELTATKGIFQGMHAAMSKYPIPVIVKTLAKAKYIEGKNNPLHYLTAVLEEQNEKNGGK